MPKAMPRRAADLIGPPHAVTAYRFDSLTGRMTDDDMFSSDLSDEELRAKLGHVAVPTLLAMSLDDEYVPRSVDPAALSKRMSGAMAAGVLGLVWRLHIDKAGHALRTWVRLRIRAGGLLSAARTEEGGRELRP